MSLALNTQEGWNAIKNNKTNRTISEAEIWSKYFACPLCKINRTVLKTVKRETQIDGPKDRKIDIEAWGHRTWDDTDKLNMSWKGRSMHQCYKWKTTIREKKRLITSANNNIGW